VAGGGIVTIHSVEQDGDIRFLTMERVEGQSLDQVIPRGGMPLGQVLEIGATLADALAASHEKGIIHRDLKPANIMLAGRERRVKVLDFGLAKLREEAAADGETTTTAALSGEGRILGTVAYMSPEQAEGKSVDARSDLFSLGTVLYEMATGERPFTGDTSISELSAILRDTPKSVTDLRADLPKEFARIIRQCLQKDPEERYQTAKDLRNQLRALKADLDSEEIAAVNPSDRNAPVPRRRRLVRWLAIGAGALTFVAITAVVAQRVGMFSRVPLSRPFESIRLKQLTDTGKVSMGAISPDGRYIVYSVMDGGFSRQSLWLRQTATGSDVQIIPPSDRGYFDMTFSTDGNFVYYTTLTGPGTGALYQIPALRGAERRVLDGVVFVSVSPDGARLAVVRINMAARESSILVTNPDGTGKRRLVTRKRPDDYQNVSRAPDGRLVYTSFAGGSEDVWSMKPDGSQPRQLTFDPGLDGGPAVSADGRFIVFFSDRSGVRTLWRMDIDGGNARQLTSVRGSWRPVLTPDGTWAVYSQVDPGTGIVTNWKVPLDGSAPRQLTSFASEEIYSFALSDDGRTLAVSCGEATTDLVMITSEERK